MIQKVTTLLSGLGLLMLVATTALAAPNQWTSVGPVVINGVSTMSYTDCDYRVQFVSEYGGTTTLPISSSGMVRNSTRSSFFITLPGQAAYGGSLGNVVTGLLDDLRIKYPNLKGFALQSVGIHVGVIKTAPAKIYSLYATIDVTALDSILGLIPIQRSTWGWGTERPVSFPDMILQQKCPNR